MSWKPVSRYAILNAGNPGRTSGSSGIPRRSESIRLASPSGARSTGDERYSFNARNLSRSVSKPPSSNDSSNTNATLSRHCSLQVQPTVSTLTHQLSNKEIPSHEAALLLATYTEKASVERVYHGIEPWSSLDSDFIALELMIMEHCTKTRAADGLCIIPNLFIITPGGSQESALKELHEFLLSSHCNMTAADVEASLIFARRIAEHFRPSNLLQMTRTITTTGPAETFNDMSVEYARDTANRGRSSRRGSLSRAAGAVKDSVKEGIRRLSRTRRANSPRGPGSRDGGRSVTRDARANIRDD